MHLVSNLSGFAGLRASSAAVISCVAVLVLTLLAVMRLGSWLAAPAADPMVADAVVVLGGDDGSSRPTRAGELFRAGFVGQVVLTGGDGKPGTVADAQADPRVKLLIGMGVPASALHFDSASRNSWEEAHHGRRMMDEKGWRRVLVVSDPPHLRRLQLAWRYALKDDGQQFVLVASQADWWHPDAWWRDERSARFVGREFMGLGYYVLRVISAASSETLMFSGYNAL